ncbi:lytic transglycosylase domain-containing protein [Parasphingorhabdus sp.]|uniref:lytic transglycosylase domain-containing protein n=1 Tax=Parasphingorhabdus sp. TaxID=2709688 RepID=UPI003D2D04A0
MSKLRSKKVIDAAIFVALITTAPLTPTPAIAKEASQSAPNTRISIAQYVTEASQRFGIPERWIYAVMRTESAGRVSATSPVGAMGLMQIMPRTWAVLRARYNLGSNAYDPRDNIHAGTAYLREMYDLFGSPGFLAAYNAGPGRYKQYATAGRPLPLETRAYVAKIVPMIAGGTVSSVATKPRSIATPAVRHWTHAALFTAQYERAERGSSAAVPSTTNDTLAPLKAPENMVPNGLFVPVSSSNSK